MIDLTLRCPVCGDRADMCFDHGDDWKQRTQPVSVQDMIDAQLRAGVNDFTGDDPPPYKTHQKAEGGDDVIGRDARGCRRPLGGLTALGLPAATQVRPLAFRVTSDLEAALTDDRTGAEPSNGPTAASRVQNGQENASADGEATDMD